MIPVWHVTPRKGTGPHSPSAPCVSWVPLFPWYTGAGRRKMDKAKCFDFPGTPDGRCGQTWPWLTGAPATVAHCMVPRKERDFSAVLHIPASVSLLYPQRPLHAPLPTWPESSQRPQSSPGFRHNKPHPSPSFLAPARGFAGPSLPPPGPRGRAGGLHPPLLTGGPRPRGLQRPAGGHVARLRQREAERTGPGPSPGPQLPRLRPRPAAGA